MLLLSTVFLTLQNEPQRLEKLLGFVVFSLKCLFVSFHTP